MAKAGSNICTKRIEARSKAQREARLRAKKEQLNASKDTNQSQSSNPTQQIKHHFSPLAWLFILLIKIYQHTLSHLIGGSCRHQPTCSNYGIQAIQKHGAIKGGWLTTKRITRCNPWGTDGYDPVP